MRAVRVVLVVVLVSFLGVLDASAQTDTPAFTPASEYAYITMIPGTGTPDGQMTRFDYVSRAGEVQIATLLALIVFSLWGMFLFFVIVWARQRGQA